ncbi:MAG: hypothetical protein ACJAWV_003660, partial [Flammeovirgaceae bacterium]
GIFDLVQNRGFYYRRPDKPIPYIFAGIAVSTNNPKAQTPTGGYRGADGSILSSPISYDANTWQEDIDAGVWVNLRDYQDVELQKIPPILISIPLGLGVRYKLTDKLDISVEAGFRWAFTDQIDGVSGRYQAFEKTNGKYPLAYFLSDRSLAYGSESSGGDNRAAIVQSLNNFYTANGGDANTYSQPASPGWDGDYNPYTNDITSTEYDPNNLGFPGERRGNDGTLLEQYSDKKPGIFSGANDIYMVYGVSLSYIFAVQVKCPKFR